MATKKTTKKPAAKKAAAKPAKKAAAKPATRAAKKPAAKKAAQKKAAPKQSDVKPKQSVAKKTEIKAAAPAKAQLKAAPAVQKPQTAQTSERLRGLKRSLFERKNALLAEAKTEIAKHINGDTRQLVDTAIDEGDWAQIDISEDLNLRRLAAHRKMIVDIDEALRKINEGTYGICEDCGDEISQKRLLVLPTATLCVDCKENRERFEPFEEKEEA